MSVHVDPSGRRSVQTEVEVPGTPEEVWAAIARGPGITSWFVPTALEERVGGSIAANFGPGMDSQSTITAWEPPHRYVAESRDDMGPEDPTVATEWIVEARGGGTCVVRVVHSWVTESDRWDEQFSMHIYGWLSFFRVLRLYLDHFRGQVGVPVQLMAVAPEPKEAVWAALTGALGLAGAEVGGRVTTVAGAPSLVGVIEWAGQPAWPEELLIRLEEPAPGIAHIVPHPMGGQVYLTVRLYLFGERAATVATAVEPVWQAWLNDRFPMSAEASAAD
jgi:uncharacterized protein YndB with AHSA1/START domain